jgi:glycosyltransferase involved in cell wall biosynthesis
MAKIKVSVIVPVYNAEKYIERCVNCLVNQTLDGVEPIFVNDGSKDNSYEMLLDFQKKYPQIKVFTKENGGQGSARNLAIENASGEYLGFVDVDDFADLTMFEIMYDKAKEGVSSMAHTVKDSYTQLSNLVNDRIGTIMDEDVVTQNRKDIKEAWADLGF